jgi:hypothetical protein
VHVRRLHSRPGKFTSADELRGYAELPPGRVDELRDLMIFS